MVASLEINKGSGRETPSAKLFGREDGERRQALCILVRIGMEESSIDGAENRRAGPNAESQGEDGNRRKDWRFLELAAGEAAIGEE